MELIDAQAAHHWRHQRLQTFEDLPVRERAKMTAVMLVGQRIEAYYSHQAKAKAEQ